MRAIPVTTDMAGEREIRHLNGIQRKIGMRINMLPCSAKSSPHPWVVVRVSLHADIYMPSGTSPNKQSNIAHHPTLALTTTATTSLRTANQISKPKHWIVETDLKRFGITPNPFTPDSFPATCIIGCEYPFVPSFGSLITLPGLIALPFE